MTTDPVVVLLRDDHEEFDALRDAVAEILGIPAGIVEKDYWATEVLRSVTRPMDGVEEYVFKGGTSLSKAFQIIQRFSEDIDLLVVTSKTGNSLKRLLRGLADRTNMELDSACVREREGKGYLNARFSYANRAEVTFLSDGVLLEMGCRGGALPNRKCRIESLLAQNAETVTVGSRSEYSDLDSFEVTVLAPERTLAEKLAFLHHNASCRDMERLRGGARHLYDVSQLLQDPSTIRALADGAIVEIMVDVDGRSDAAGWPFTRRPVEGFVSSPAFGDDPEIVDALQLGYEDIAPLIWGDRPGFETIISNVVNCGLIL